MGKPARQSWCFTVDPCESGHRLDQLIPARTGLSRHKVREILHLGGVQINRRRVRVAGRMPRIGAEIRVALDESIGDVPDFKPDILFEDDWMLAVNKPSGIPTQGTQASDRHDVFAVIQNNYPNQKLHLTHRLDTGTSGVLLLAKGTKMADEICSLFRNRLIKKTYLASIQNQLEPCLLEVPIGRIPNSSPARYGCKGNLIDPKPSATNFFLIDSNEISREGLWVVAEPLTGRTHQVRAHLAHLGNPVIGDVFYGGVPSDRIWLHAWKLEFIHPADKNMIKIQASNW